MNWNAVIAIAEVIGVIVVILSLVYFGIQLRQSNKHAEASSLTAWMDAWNRLLNDLVTDESVQDTIRKGLQSFHGLTKHEQALFHMKIAALVNHWLLTGSLQEKQLISDEIYEGCTDFVISILSCPGGLEYWEFDAEATPKGGELLEMIKSGNHKLKPLGELLPWWSPEDEVEIAERGLGDKE